MAMWNEADVRTELEDAKKVRKQCRELGDVGQAVYWSGYARALEVVLNDGGKEWGEQMSTLKKTAGRGAEEILEYVRWAKRTAEKFRKRKG